MDLATFISLGLKTSIFLTVFGLALQTTLEAALCLFRRPSGLAPESKRQPIPERSGRNDAERRTNHEQLG